MADIPPKSKIKHTKHTTMIYKSIRIKLETLQKIEKMAANDSRTFSGMLRRIIEKGIERETK